MVFDRDVCFALFGHQHRETISHPTSEIVSSGYASHDCYIALVMNFTRSFFIFLSEGMWMYIICPAS